MQIRIIIICLRNYLITLLPLILSSICINSKTHAALFVLLVLVRSLKLQQQLVDCDSKTVNMFELSSLTTIKGDDLKWRLIRSGALLLSYFSHGMGLGVVGPTMLDIQIRTNTTISEITFIIIGRAAGLSIGSFLGKSTIKAIMFNY